MAKKHTDANQLIRRARLAQILVLAGQAASYLRPEDVVAKVAYKKMQAWVMKGGNVETLLVFGRTLEAELRRAETAHNQMPKETCAVNPAERSEAYGPIYRLALITILAMCLEYACGGDETTFSHVQEYLDEIPECPWGEEEKTLLGTLDSCPFYNDDLPESAENS